MIVKRLYLDAGRQARPNRTHLIVNEVRDLHSIAVRLPIDAEQDRRLSLSGNHRINRRDSGSNRSHIANPDRHVVGILDHHGANFFSIVDLAIHETEE